MPFKDTVFGTPTINERSFADPTATVIGDVQVEELVLVGPSAVLRADEQGPFRICKGSNIQDHACLHGHKDAFVEIDGKNYSIYIGEEVTMAHRGLIHGPAAIGKKTFLGAMTLVWGSEIGQGCFIDHAARIRNAKVGNNCRIGMGAIVTDVVIPDGKHVPDLARINKKTDVSALEDIRPEELAKCLKKSGEIVKINHDLVTKHQLRAKKMQEQRFKEMFDRINEERLRQIENLRKNPRLQGRPDFLRIAEAVFETMSEVKAEQINGTNGSTGEEKGLEGRAS